MAPAQRGGWVPTATHILWPGGFGPGFSRGAVAALRVLRASVVNKAFLSDAAYLSESAPANGTPLACRYNEAACVLYSPGFFCVLSRGWPFFWRSPVLWHSRKRRGRTRCW